MMKCLNCSDVIGIVLTVGLEPLPDISGLILSGDQANFHHWIHLICSPF